MLSTTVNEFMGKTYTLKEIFYDAINNAEKNKVKEVKEAWINLALRIYNKCSDLQEQYTYTPFGIYSKRFQRKDYTAFDDEINYSAPKIEGLYFIGETHFNPITDEKYYWVKIGRATNLNRRMKDYNTHNPMLWRIDFSENYDKEKYYHLKLNDVAIASCNHNEEWFLVDKNTYLEMCEKGFSYFD